MTFHPMGIARYTVADDPRRPFDQDQWELYNVAEDPAECNDLAATHAEKLAELQELWWWLTRNTAHSPRNPTGL